MHHLSAFVVSTICLLSSSGGAVSGADSPSRVETGSVSLEVRRTFKYEYAIKLPKGYDDSTERWPMILHLHGSGAGSLKNVQASLDSFNRPFVMVCPFSEGGWDPDTLAKLVKEVIAKYRVDADRVYLMGYSMGGHGTWDLACKHPHLFAAIAPIAGWGDALSAGDVLCAMPVWAFHGAKDTTIEPEMSKILVETINAHGGDARLTLLPDVGHGSHELVMNMSELYEWFLGHRRRILAPDEIVEKAGECARTAVPPAIDGDLSDPAWNAAAPISDFVFPHGGVVSVQTVVRLLYDDANLYVSVLAFEPRLSGMTVTHAERDSDVWEDDSVDVMLDTTNSKKAYYHFIVNPNGVLYDAKTFDKSWNCEKVAVKTIRRTDAWAVEMSIPWASLGMAAPAPGQTIRVEFARTRYNGTVKINSQWAPTHGWNHVPERYGTITFTGKK